MLKLGLSQDLCTGALPGANCHSMEDDLKACQNNIKPDHKLDITRTLKPKTRRRLSVKNEKKVEKGELDEIFARIHMKNMKKLKSKQEMKEKKLNMDDENHVKNETRMKNEKENMQFETDEKKKKENIMDEKAGTDKKKKNVTKKKENLMKEKPIIEEKKQPKLTNWLQLKINDEKMKYEYGNDEKDGKVNDENGKKKISERENVKKQEELDNKTPKSKFKSVMKKFENNEKEEEKMKNERKMMKNEMKCERNEKENEKETNGTSIKTLATFTTLGESWKGTHWETLTPSSVMSPERSAAKGATKGQYFDIHKQSNMSRKEMGQSEKFSRKRKNNENEENKLIEEAFSPKKLPKLTLKKTLFFPRLGGDPGKGNQRDKMLDKGDN